MKLRLQSNNSEKLTNYNHQTRKTIKPKHNVIIDLRKFVINTMLRIYKHNLLILLILII